MINELFISEFCSCFLIEKECPVPCPSGFFCNCICRLLVLSCYVGFFLRSILFFLSPFLSINFPQEFYPSFSAEMLSITALKQDLCS